MARKNPLPSWAAKGEKKYCDICGQTYRAKELKKQKGWWKCKNCFDTPSTKS